MSSYFSESRYRNWVGSAMCPECLSKVVKASAVGYTLRKSCPETVQGSSGVTISPTLVGPVLMHEPTELFNTFRTGVQYIRTSISA